jgi:CRISPR/Cas system type I-B associated protein Csh2 (Cas7 group RAMP superfamily)
MKKLVLTVVCLKAPICNFCAKTGALCPEDSKKLKSGQITTLDVESSVKLTKLAEKDKIVDKLAFVKAIESNGEIVLLFGSGNLKLLRSSPKTIEDINRLFGRKVWLFEADATDRKLMEEAFYPTRILTVNMVWLPDGSKLTKVILPYSRGAEEKLDEKAVKRVLKLLRGLDVMIEYERRAST